VRRVPPETKIEAVPRDPPVKTPEVPDRLSTSALLGRGLQRLYAPVLDKQPDPSRQKFVQNARQQPAVPPH